MASIRSRSRGPSSASADTSAAWSSWPACCHSHRKPLHRGRRWAHTRGRSARTRAWPRACFSWRRIHGSSCSRSCQVLKTPTRGKLGIASLLYCPRGWDTPFHGFVGGQFSAGRGDARHFVTTAWGHNCMGIHTTIARGVARSKRNVVFWQHFDPFGAMWLTVSRIVPYGANRVVSPVNWPRRPVTMLA